MPEATYTVLARRFRPQTFADVIGQEHVGQALRNAIRAGRVAHAYLFTGARGVGKTSTARIFAKALNCPHAVDAVPCNQCDICEGISAGNDVDVLEIDGASNRGIDDIRQLRANVNVKSMRSKYKVYIIDEVHMLTKEAFNALLKTLEEPPPNVKFVFCTTEPNKVPDTILSRCQRFDFGTIATDSIAARLRDIAELEGMRVDADAVDLVARRAAGSMRDSQSLFDQLLAFGAEHITADDVHRLLGTAPDSRLVELFEALIARDRAGVLTRLADALAQGVQLGPLSDQLLEYLRDLLVVQVGADGVTLASVGESLRDTLRDQGTRWGLRTITTAMQILADTKGRMQRGNYGRALLELALIRVSLLEDLDDLSQLLRQLGTGSGGPPAAPSGLANHPAGTPAAASPTTGGRKSDALRDKLRGPGTGGSATSAPGGERSVAPASEPRVMGGTLTATAPQRGSGTFAIASRSKSDSAVQRGAGLEGIVSPPIADLVECEGETTISMLVAPAKEGETPPRPEPPAGSPVEVAEPPFRSMVVPPGPIAARRAPPEEVPPPGGATDAAAVASTLGNTTQHHDNLELTPDNLDAIWAQVIQHAPDTLATHLKNAERLAISGPNALEVHFPVGYLFSMSYCSRPESAGQISRCLEHVVGRTLQIRFSIDKSPASVPSRDGPGRRPADDVRLRPKTVENDPFVQQAVSIFGGTVVDVRKVLDEPRSTASPAASTDDETETVMVTEEEE